MGLASHAHGDLLQGGGEIGAGGAGIEPSRSLVHDRVAGGAGWLPAHQTGHHGGLMGHVFDSLEAVATLVRHQVQDPLDDFVLESFQEEGVEPSTWDSGREELERGTEISLAGRTQSFDVVLVGVEDLDLVESSLDLGRLVISIIPDVYQELAESILLFLGVSS